MTGEIKIGQKFLCREDETRMNQRRVLTVKSFECREWEEFANLESHNRKTGSTRRVRINLLRLKSSAYRRAL